MPSDRANLNSALTSAFSATADVGNHAGDGSSGPGSDLRGVRRIPPAQGIKAWKLDERSVG